MQAVINYLCQGCSFHSLF